MPLPESRRPEAPEAPPHPTLRSYYAADPERSRYVLDLFDETARHSNTVERLFGNGGLLYRRLSLRRAGLRPGMRVLDVAIGTAAVARGAVRIVGPSGRVFGVDPSMGMMREARKVFRGPLTRGVAQTLPFRSASFDFVTMGIALRHVSDLVAAFSEYHRVLRPGGRVWILEGHVPASQLGHRLTRFAWKTVIPGLTLLATRDRRAKELMDYYWDTVEQCVPPAQIVEAMRKAGFERPRFQVVVPGAFCEYTATKEA
ncbi:MAG TPA: class I SAM-dependent methyltransferase [Myxococcota bacterium]|nr:class I SAM-dependent methyltransferase [Myxococcota bacterium]